MRCARFVILAIACAACAQAQHHDFEVTQNLRLYKSGIGGGYDSDGQEVATEQR